MKIDFGDIKIGCIKTPKPFSYYCESHINEQLTFEVEGKFMTFMPNSIKATNIINEAIHIVFHGAYFNIQIKHLLNCVMIGEGK